MITLKDLALQLKVSPSTVSKALNGSKEIGQETKKRVNELAKFYNYKPNSVALSLKRNQTKTIGVIIPNVMNRFFAKVLFGIEQEAAKKGFQIITCLTNETLSKEQESLKHLSNGSVDGFIMAVSEETQKVGNIDHIKTANKNGIPIVMFDRVIEEIQCDKVIIDDFNATRKATNKLLESGRNKIAFITTIDNLNVGKLRQKGYEFALKKDFDHLSETLVLKLNNHHSLQDQLKSFIEEYSDIDGVIAADNISGTIFINVAFHLGLRIPEDISVIGFSDSIISEMSIPRLSFLDQNAILMGSSALNLMIERLRSNSAKFVTKKINVDLVDQESTYA